MTTDQISSFLRGPRRIFVISCFLAPFVFPNAVCQAQSIVKIYGRIIGPQGPISGAIIKLVPTNLVSRSNADGQYELRDVPPGDYFLECAVASVGASVATPVRVEEGPPVRIDLYVEKGVINVPDVVVRAHRPVESSQVGPVRVLVRDQSDQDLTQLVRQIGGLDVIVSGNGEILVRGRGSRPEGVQVLLDGRPINSLLTGRADLSQVPMEAVKAIEYYPSGVPGTLGGGALGGTLNFVTKVPRLTEYHSKLEACRGTFGRETYVVEAIVGRSSYGDGRIMFQSDFRRNDYLYTDYFGMQRKRQNAWAQWHRQYASYALVRPRFRLNLSGFGSTGSSGVPGRIISPSPTATSKKSMLSLGGDMEFLLAPCLELVAGAYYQKKDASFIDSGGTIPYHTRYDELEKSAFLSVTVHLTHSTRIGCRLSVSDGVLRGEDLIRPQAALGTTKRQIAHLGGDLSHDEEGTWWRLHSNFSGGIDYVGDKPTPSWAAGVSACVGRKVPVTAFVAAGRSFRLPGLAELHWKEDVFVVANPDLKPETGRFCSMGLSCAFDALGRWQCGVEYQDARYRDQILWRRSQGVKYKPVNVSAADYFGTECFLAFRTHDDFLFLRLSRTDAVAINRELDQPYWGKILTFQPPYVNHLTCGLKYKIAHLALEVYDVGKRYFLEENTKALAPYTLVNISLSLSPKYKGVEFPFEVGADNVGNCRYELVEYQPMPPRTWWMSLAVKF